MSDFHFSPRPNRAGDIRWRQWGDQAFAEAAEQNKPVLLAISAVWCHWCHVMDETTYSDSGVIDAINDRFIPVRVDNDRRPDVNARYNQGGWPTTALLTPDGEILKGATYVPPDSMRSLLAQIDAFYSDPENRRDVAVRIEDLKRRRSAPRVVRRAALKSDIPARVFSFLDASFDEEYGGFGVDQKFPQTAVLHFLLDLFARRRDARAGEIAARTLHAMADGGMYDHVHGGFYRYSTNRDFSVPHYEKMLEDLGGLMLACARASAMFGDESLGRVAIEVRSYLDARLWQPAAKAYGGSQDADETYYTLDASGRAALPEPYVDPTVYTSWNAETALALIVAGPLLASCGADPAEWTARGLAVVESLWATVIVDGAMCRYHDGEPHVRGLLGDQAWAGMAAVTAFEATGDRRWLERARDLVRHAEPLYDEDACAYADRQEGPRESARLAEKSFPFDENALMARVLIALGAHGEDEWLPRSNAMLESWAESYRSYGSFASAYASAVLDRVEPPLTITIVGPRGDPETAALLQFARTAAIPPNRPEIVDPILDLARLASLGQKSEDRPVAYLCDERTCFARARSSAELSDAMSHVPT